METEQITLGGGCFWCIEAAFSMLSGVQSAISGYAAGQFPNPDYESVCTGTTGHAEVVQLSFDTNEIDLKTVLQVFFTLHDPTTLNRQGNDIGTQYRSIILYQSEAQKQLALDTIRELASLWPSPIVTEVKPLEVFYPAEDYHQSYYRQNRAHPYCQVIINPKIAKLKNAFSGLLRG
ncbi:MAG: peptide-methionine (S)-S-oxide reductase [Gammaproteobacteria bacterium]|nr:MAG: peptide-methionine (S)-S-oxide reductase [Gammaproteobacteria bacterium]